MYALLQWLYDRAYRVYEFFGSLYYSIRNVALNAWSWILSARTAAYNWAVSKASAAYSNAISWYYTYVKPWVDQAYAWAVQALNTVSNYLSIVSGWIAAKVQALWADVLAVRSYLVGQIAYWYGRAVGAAQAIVDGVVAIINARIEATKQSLTTWVYNVENKINKITDELGLSDPTKMESFMTFVNNPLAWFGGYLTSIFMVVLEYSLAYALGSTTDMLPPWPSFLEGGEGGVFHPVAGPPPGTSPLAPPLSKLWRSGHPFGVGHLGIDFGCVADQPVYACHDGKVLVAGWTSIGYGNYIVLQGAEWWSLYAHLNQIDVSEGENVSAQQPIGLCGCVGNSTCNHLHLELKHYGGYVDPGIVFGVG